MERLPQGVYTAAFRAEAVKYLQIEALRLKAVRSPAWDGALSAKVGAGETALQILQNRSHDLNANRWQQQQVRKSTFVLTKATS